MAVRYFGVVEQFEETRYFFFSFSFFFVTRAYGCMSNKLGRTRRWLQGPYSMTYMIGHCLRGCRNGFVMWLFSLYSMEKADNRLRISLNRYVLFMAILLQPIHCHHPRDDYLQILVNYLYPPIQGKVNLYNDSILTIP